MSEKVNSIKTNDIKTINNTDGFILYSNQSSGTLTICGSTSRSGAINFGSTGGTVQTNQFSIGEKTTGDITIGGGLISIKPRLVMNGGFNFPSSLSNLNTNGHFILSGNVYGLQFGVLAFSAVSQPVVFPTPFPTSCVHVSLHGYTSTSTNAFNSCLIYSASDYTPTGFTLNIYNPTINVISANFGGYSYIAIGY
jgi:hypothetical protein